MSYRHILACTDGSPRARKAVAAAAKLAGICHANLTVLFVIPPYVLPAYGEAAQYVPGVTPHLYKQRADALAKKVLAPAARLARDIGLQCETLAVNAYAEFHWAHMRCEEQELLPLAETALSAEDWEAIEAAFAGNSDPIADLREQDFDKLFTRIVNIAPAPIGLGEAWRRV